MRDTVSREFKFHKDKRLWLLLRCC
jgi:hypothetical protein